MSAPIRKAWILATIVFAAVAGPANAQYPAWKHSGSLWILTTPEGANLPATTLEKDFPLLVRLHRDFFDFSQAQADGADLRFSTSTGIPLAYQIDEWDPAQGTASIWVRIPEIKGNARQEIKLHWGKPDAASTSSGTTVFNDANGYLSVWHMTDPAADAVGTLQSVDKGTTSVAGVIGKARRFAPGQGIRCGENIVNYPSGAQAHTSDASRSEVTLEFDQPVVWHDALASQFYLDGGAEKIASASAAGNMLRLKITAPSKVPTITYLDSKAWSQKTLLQGQNGLAALTFCKVPILAARLTGHDANGARKPQPPPGGDAVIRRKWGNSEIVITTTGRLAGAIHSLTWNGKECIDSADHGRQLQSAASFQLGSGKFNAETYNPTEAGSRKDGAGPQSTSRLLELHAQGNQLRSKSRLAFWLAPGEKSAGDLARNDHVLSDHLLAKRVVIGVKDLPNVLDYQVTFTVPRGEKANLGQFEVLTGYMPEEFSTFWRLNPETGKLLPLDDGPGEQAMPVILATADGQYAMGIVSATPPGFGPPGYGRWRFGRERVVKWNTVFRIRDARAIATGEYAFQNYVAIGTLEDVRAALMTVMPR